jgi:SAM-dependent methyltransferase
MKQKPDCPLSPELNSALCHWLNSSPGRELLDLERACLGRLLEERFGYYLLQVGLPLLMPESSHSEHIQTRINLLAPGGDARVENGIFADPLCLPVASDSLDLVLMPHALDFSSNPHQLLREAERVLIPEGRVIISGFNPWSLWGARRSLPIGRQRAPWCGQFLPQRRLSDWLSLLGFAVEKSEVLMFRPPIPHTGIMRRLDFMERMGQRLWPFLAGVYVIQAVKRVSTLTPIRPAWKLRPRRIRGQVVEPTARSIE